MNQHFLCPRLRHWLRARPERVLPVWEVGMERAQRMMADGDWYRALPHAGSALEAAQLMVRDARHCSRAWLSRHAATRELLKRLERGLSAGT
jgi:hypothetical protein